MPDTAKAHGGPDKAEPEGKDPAKTEAMVREMLGRVADKWTLLVIEALSSGGEMGFSRLPQSLAAVGQKRAAHTLRQPSRHGLVTRRAYPAGSPRAWYNLSAPRGRPG